MLASRCAAAEVHSTGVAGRISSELSLLPLHTCQSGHRHKFKFRLGKHIVRASAVAQQADDVATAFDYGLASAQGPRDTMEDEAAVIEQGKGGYFWAGVFDGHGGDAASQWLSSNLYDYLSKRLSDNSPAAHSDIIASFQEADSVLLKMLEEGVDDEGEPLTGAGSTASVLFVKDEHIVVANVGDSSAILSRQARQVMLTVPHRVYGKDDHVAKEIARVEAAGGWVSDCRVCDVLAVSRAFGDWEFKGKGLTQLLKEGVENEWWDQAFADNITFTSDPVIVTPAVSTVDLCEDDEFIVMATDGLWDFYPQSEAFQFARTQLKGGASAQSVAEDLVDRALKRYTSDNVAVVVIKFPWAFKQSSNGAGVGKKSFKWF